MQFLAYAPSKYVLPCYSELFQHQVRVYAEVDGRNTASQRQRARFYLL